MRWRPAALIMVTILVATSCNGDDDTASTTEAPSTTAPATTVEATTTDAPSTTEAPATDPTTTPPTTTSDATTTEPTITATTPPTTSSTTGEPVDERFAVLDAVEAATEASLAVLRDPFDDDKVAALEDHFFGGQLTGWKNIVERYRDENQKQIENPEEPDAFIVSLASLAVSVDGTSATVQGCEITSGVIVEIGGNPDGTDRVIEDGIARGITELILTKVDGTWKVEQAREPAPDEQIATCP